ncbi:iron complex outermembrane receptor protein [Sphingomonas sp. UYAg733]
MTNSFNFGRKVRLLGAAAPFALILAAQPAFAQDAAPAAPAAEAAQEDTGQDIVVTGSILRRTNTETPSPVTVLTSDDLDKRGVNTVQEALQTLSANNGGTLMNSFSANGAFAGGASAASLRGLTTSSTLVLFDGLRAAYYPLADDGSRNFVDLNTIPDAIVDRVEVLKDGASSTYGADAVAGVINIITKKQFVGFSARVEAGISEQGDAANQRLEATAGFGDLDEKGFNIYASGHYVHSDILYNNQRGAPYNSSNLSSRCATSILPQSERSAYFNALTCDANNVGNGLQNGAQYGDGVARFAGQSTGTLINYARPANALTGAAIGGTRYQQLTNPGGGCGPLNAITLTGNQLTNNLGNGGATAPANGVVCQEDFVNRYSVIAPEIERIGGSIRGTVKLGDNIEAYGIFNYEQSRVKYTGLQAIYRGTTTPGPLLQRYTTASTPLTQGAGGLFGQLITLPVYICPRGTTVACTAGNGALNPNNPFATVGQRAAIIGRLSDIQETNETFNQAYRGAIGVSGSFGEGWNFAVDATGMRVDLQRKLGGRIYVQNFLDAVNDGSYNWVNPEQNSQAVRDFIAPLIDKKATSELYQIQGSISKALFELPGGPLQVAVGASYREEKVNAPSLNPGVLNQPTQQYIRVNGFSSQGSRNVKSAYFEIGAPVVDQLELNVSGRYDKYSTGDDNFSPKFAAKFTPIPQIAIRGTYSRGFRIPSFAETGSSPTTGFITTNAPASCRTQNPIGDATYCNGYSLGLSQAGAPGLKPEKSRNITAGVILEPVKWLTVTADYYNIKKTNVITGDDYTPALAAYYANQPIPAGFQVIADVPSLPDVAVNPNAQPRAAFVLYSYVNGPTQKTSGLDFTATARVPLGEGIRFTSSVDATYVIDYKQSFPGGGGTQSYAGTLGNFQITSGSGTPQWRGNWQNTLDFGAASISATAYYTQGYSTTAEDSSGAGSSFICGVPALFDSDVTAANPGGDGIVDSSSDANSHTYNDGVTPVQCDVKHFVNVDMSASYNVNDNFTFYVNVLNLFGAKAPLDATTYGGYQYNPAWANSGIIGRSFRVGAKVKF